MTDENMIPEKTEEPKETVIFPSQNKEEEKGKMEKSDNESKNREKHSKHNSEHEHNKAHKKHVESRKHHKKNSEKHAGEHSGSKKTQSDKVKMWLIIILGAVLLVNVILLFNIYGTVNGKLNQAKLAAILPKVQATVLAAPDCSNCFDASTAIDSVKNSGVNITGENTVSYDSTEGKALVAKYGILKVPTVVLTGETSDLTIDGFTSEQGDLVFTSVQAPYTETATGDVRGLVEVTYLKADNCNECQDLTQTIDQLASSGITFTSRKTVDYSSSQGNALVQKYNISKVPTLIMSSELGAYEQIDQAWNVIGSVESDGSYILRAAETLGIPYYDVKEQKTMGLVDVTYITDDSCASCYNVSVHKLILQRFGVKFGQEKTVDISSSEGKALIAKYDITKVPAVIMSKDADVYTSLKQVWLTVGVIAEDGTYAFTMPEAMGGSVYKDLTTGQILGQQTSAAQGNVQVSG